MISFIIPSLGRPSLRQTIASIETEAGDEIIVVGTDAMVRTDPRPTYIMVAPGNDWGRKERTRGMQEATQPYLAFIDDDDTYAPGHRALMRHAITTTPDAPVLFRMQYPNGFVLWREPHLISGNVSTQMILIPNDRAKLGAWTNRREGDYDFLASMRWPMDSIVWRPEVIAYLGKNDAC